VSQTRKCADATAEIRSTPMNGHRQTGATGLFSTTNRRQPTPGTGQSRVTAPSLEKPGKVALDGPPTQEAVLAVGATSTRSSKASSGTSAGCNELLATQDIPIIEKSDVRVRKRTEAPTLVSHILLKQARGGYPRQHLTMVKVVSESPGRKSDYC
jgi:hypothetical protein